MPHVPIWVVALVLAVLAPMIVRAVATFLERRARERTLAALAHARREPPRKTEP